MATREVNEAVAAYRKVQTLEWKRELAEKVLGRLIEGLSYEDMAQYANMTVQIDKAVDRVQASIAASGLSDSTADQRMRNALNDAGRDAE